MKLHPLAVSALFVSHFSLALDADAQTPARFEPATLWDTIPLPAGSTLGGPPIGKSLACELTADGLLDVPFERAGELQVIVNAGHWKHVESVGSAGSKFDDLAAFRRGSLASDALLTLGRPGLSAWRWDGSAFVEEVLVGNGPWSEATSLAAWSLGTGTTLVGVWDGVQHVLHLYEVEERRGPGEGTGVSPRTPLSLSFDLTHLAFVDFLGDVAHPAVAFCHDAGVEVRSLDDQSLLTSNGTGTIDMTTFGSSAEFPDRLAWVFLGDTGAGPELRVLGPGGAEPDLALPGLAYQSIVAATDAVGEVRLALTHAGVGALVLETCNTESASSFCYDAGDPLIVGDFVPAGAPVFADLHVSEVGGLPDVLLFDVPGAQAAVHRGACVTEGNLVGNISFDNVFPNRWARLVKSPIPPVESRVFVDLELMGDLHTQASEVELLVYRWQNYPGFQMDPEPIAQFLGAPAQEIKEMLKVELEPGRRVRIAVIELRVHRDVDGQREVLVTGNYAMAREGSSAYQSLVQGAAPYCPSVVTGPNVRGVIRISGLPLFFD